MIRATVISVILMTLNVTLIVMKPHKGFFAIWKKLLESLIYR